MTQDGKPAAAAWVRQSVCVHHLQGSTVVHVTGDDARAWLNGQTTNDVREVTEDSSVYALSLDAKGRIQADLWVTSEPEGMGFVAASDACEGLLAEMDRYIIMDDVELSADDALAVVTLQGPLAATVLTVVPDGVRHYASQRVGAGGFDLWVPRAELESVLTKLAHAAAAQDGGVADAKAWADAHVHEATGRFGHDFDQKTYPQEAGLGARAVSFDKGCYLGQEVVCMLENRGKLARQLVLLEGPEGAAPAPGAKVVDGQDARVGEITSVASAAAGAPGHALALLKSAVTEPGHAVKVGADTWKVVRPAG